MKPKSIRCAIYTRKSTEHNLDLEFNSLHAQREACEAYIKSQMHEGWLLVPDPYDDGGISGASLDRPDIQRLLRDIAAGKVDNVVVYKVDRLTRSLTDFAKLVEIFDKHGVSFVSVTQSFNTTNSMGRLTLNVLLSFAQFEREVIGERVKDKIAASKKKGLFMGGNIPLGYINRDKKLVIVPEEAERVRWMYRRYLELGSIGRLLEELGRLGIKTKQQTLANGKSRGGVCFGKGSLAYLLKNRCYVGEVVHQGVAHPAAHEPIVERTTFEAVQASLVTNTVARKARAKASPFLLAGILFDSAGNRMTPSHSRKKGVRYRYYISQAILQGRKAEVGAIDRVSAPDIEALIESFVRERCRGHHGDLRAVVEAQIAKATVHDHYISVELAASDGPEGPPLPSGQIVSLPWSKKPVRAAKGITSVPAARISGSATEPQVRVPLLTAIGRARAWVDKIMAGATAAEIARQENKSERYIRLLMPLAFVPPQSLRDIVEGRSFPSSIHELAKTVSLAWSERN